LLQVLEQQSPAFNFLMEEPNPTADLDVAANQVGC
jgi:hypothetical protein